MSVRFTQVAQQCDSHFVLARDLRNVLSVVQTVREVRSSDVEIAYRGAIGTFKDDLILIIFVVDDLIVLVFGLDREIGDLARGGF